jgi:hypothetical protein
VGVEAIPMRARTAGSQTFVSLNSRLEGNKEKKEGSGCLQHLLQIHTIEAVHALLVREYTKKVGRPHHVVVAN